MQARLSGHLTIAGLAREAGVSATQLTRLFRQDTGMTPGAYLRQQRLTRAGLLVERTTLPISVVMKQVGISDRSHFARDFRRLHGLSPRALRVQLRTLETRRYHR